MKDIEEQKVELFSIDQEDDNLLGISPVNADSLLCVSPLQKAMEQASIGNLENCYGHDSTAVVAGVGLAPVPCIMTNSVLSEVNFNVIRDNMDESWLRKGHGVKESIHLDGIAEDSLGKEFENFSSRLSRSHLDTGNEQGGMTPEKKGGEPTFLRNNRSRRSTMLRKSLAWDKAFFTDEGVLNNDELFAVASDTPKTLTMPELATIWDGPQTVLAPIEAHATPTKIEVGTEQRSEVRKGVVPKARKGISSALKQEGRPVVNSKPQQDVSHTSRYPDIKHTSSLRPVRQIHTVGSQTFSNAYSRVAIPQGFTSLPLPNGLPRTGDRLEAGGRKLIANSGGTGSDIYDQQMREPRSTSTGLHHQARLAALKKAHEAPLPLEPRVRLPTSNSLKKAEEKQLEEVEKAKHAKKVEHKFLQEVHVLKQCKMKAKCSDELHLMNTTLKMEPELTRSMSASALNDSPSALSRKVSLMSKKVKETLEKVISGRARRVSNEPSLSHVHPVEKASMLLKMSGSLPTVPEVKDPSHRTKPNAAVVPVKLSKDTFTVRDILRSRVPSSSPKETLKQGPALLRSKSACGVRCVPRATDPLLAPPVSQPPPPPPPVQPSEPVRKPTGLRKPSPKLGFFDTGGVSSAPLKELVFSQPLQGLQSVKTGSDASVPIEQLGRRLHGFAPATISSAIPSAPHLRHGLNRLENSNCADEFRDPQTEKQSSSETTYDYPGPSVSDRELSIISMIPISSPSERPENSRSSVGQGPNEETEVTDLPCYSPHSRRFRELCPRAVNSCEHTNKASRDDAKPDSGCPCTPPSKDYSHRTVSKKFDSPRSASFREMSCRTNTCVDSPVAASKRILRSHSQRVSGGDSSLGVGPSTPVVSGGKFCNSVFPSHSPDPTATFEVLTPSSSKNARGTRSPSSSGKTVVRKILEFESPSSQWSNWPVLGAVISADQLPVSAKEGLSFVSPRPLREQGSEQSTDARLSSPASSSSLKVKHLEVKGVSHEQCSSASQPRLSFSTGCVGSSSNAMSAETDSGTMDRSSVLGLTEAEIFPSTPPSGRKDRFSSMSSLARKAISRLTSSPTPSDLHTQEDGATPKSSHKTSRRFSRPGSSSNCLSPELKPLPAFSEARICELEAAGPEILEKKSGPVQNSPPDKVAPESNPWSSVRKNGQPLGPFDCTKLKHISPVRTTPVA